MQTILRIVTGCLSIVVSTTACKSVKKPLLPYTIEIEKSDLNVLSSSFEDEATTDTIMADNDTTAYQKGLISYYSKVATEKSFKAKGIIETSRTKSFKVLDTAGLNIKYNLSKEVVDSLTVQVEKAVKNVVKL